MNFAVTATVDQKTQAQLKAALEQFPLAVQDRIVRNAIRPFLNKEMQQIRALNATKLNPRHLKGKVKIFRSGVAWGSTAYRTGKVSTGQATGRARRELYDLEGVGWRSHFTELGTHTWSSALRRPPRARGLGWKRGLYHRNRGNYLRGTHASEIVHRAMAPLFAGMLRDALNLAIQKRNAGVGGAAPAMRMVQEF